MGVRRLFVVVTALPDNDSLLPATHGTLQRDRFGGLLMFRHGRHFLARRHQRRHGIRNHARGRCSIFMVSYGGSALASMMFGIGVMINVSMRRYIFEEWVWVVGFG